LEEDWLSESLVLSWGVGSSAAMQEELSYLKIQIRKEIPPPRDGTCNDKCGKREDTIILNCRFAMIAAIDIIIAFQICNRNLEHLV